MKEEGDSFPAPADQPHQHAPADAILASDDVKELQRRCAALEAALAVAEKQRSAERAARIRIQRQLRATSLVEPGDVHGSGGGGAQLRARAVGTLHSCFSRRNGTPRQPGLVTSARAVLALRRGVPFDCLTGLEGFSHCWVVYLFHQNTDLHSSGRQTGDRSGAGIKSRVAVPRLDGDTRGVFATRTPHRPVPLGLSLGRLRGVDRARGLVHFDGLDVVDGTPVMDIKPYVPFCDAPRADAVFAPDWVAPVAGGDEAREPLRIASVTLAQGAQHALWTAYTAAEARRLVEWTARHPPRRGATVPDAADEDDVPPAMPPALYETPEEFASLVTQVLSRDIRALRHRTGAPDKRLPVYRVILCCVEVDYTLDDDSRAVMVLHGRTALPEDDWAAAQDAAAAEIELSGSDEDNRVGVETQTSESLGQQ